MHQQPPTRSGTGRKLYLRQKGWFPWHRRRTPLPYSPLLVEEGYRGRAVQC